MLHAPCSYSGRDSLVALSEDVMRAIDRVDKGRAVKVSKAIKCVRVQGCGGLKGFQGHSMRHMEQGCTREGFQGHKMRY